ncbi:MAG: ATP-binding protein [Actinomycetota bacterium]
MAPDRNALLLEAFDDAPTSLSLSDVEGSVIYANRRFYELFGHDPEAELRVSDLSRPEDLEWTASYLQQLVSGEISRFQTVKHFRRADHTEFDADLTIRSIHHGQECVGMIASVEPVALRPKVDDVRIRKLLEHSAGTLTLIDADGHVVETSGRYRATLGYPEEFWEDRTIFDVLVPEDAARVLAMRDDVLSEPGREVTGDFRVIGADRRIETLEVTATNLLDDPDLRGIVVTSRNVTRERADRRAVEAQADDAVAEADRRSNLIATVSHELRNPLHAMTGMAELLASDRHLTSEQHDLAVALQRQLTRLADVADDLLDTARFEVGEFRLRPGSVDVRDLLDDVVRTAQSAAGDRLEVGVRVADDIPHTLTADGARVQQILGNLLGNAVKFTERGSVTIDVRRDGDTLVAAVVDTGPGIAPDDADRVFEAFTTLPSGGGRRGAGLGLTIVHRLVEAMSGGIAVSGRPGVGTTFTVRLPLLETASDAGTPVAPSSPTAPHAVVLVVEDTPVNQDLARAQLTRLGHECLIVSSAEDGLLTLESETVDVVLMDHQLPGMNGRDATREIRRRGWSVPVIGVTASSTAADERACLDAGMNAFLPKPVGLDRLRDVLTTVLTDRTAASSAPHDPGGSLGTETADAVVAATVHQPAIDRSALDELVEELADRSTVEQLVGSFLDELDARSADIAGSDDTAAARQAHALKSSAALLGATELADACREAERSPERRNDIHELARAARIELEQWVDEGRS